MHEYIQDNFSPDDWLVIARKGDYFKQRFVTVSQVLEPRFQTWLKEQSDIGENIYVSMNALVAGTQGRTKQDIAAIRHIYLDIDHDGQAALARIKADAALPQPSYILTTSPDKYQVIWKVDGFDAEDAEALQKTMALRYGADRAATDVTRVLRVPGTTNWKYDPPYAVKAEKFSGHIYSPSDFRIDRLHEYSDTVQSVPVNNTRIYGKNGSQSERDWNEVCRRLERGDNPADVRDWLEASRQDKDNPKYYAERTVRRAESHVMTQGKIQSTNLNSLPKKEINIDMQQNHSQLPQQEEKPLDYNEILLNGYKIIRNWIDAHVAPNEAGWKPAYLSELSKEDYKIAMRDIGKDLENNTTLLKEAEKQAISERTRLERAINIAKYAVESFEFHFNPRNEPYTFLELAEEIESYYNVEAGDPRIKACVDALKVFPESKFLKTHLGLKTYSPAKIINAKLDDNTKQSQKDTNLDKHYDSETLFINPVSNDYWEDFETVAKCFREYANYMQIPDPIYIVLSPETANIITDAVNNGYDVWTAYKDLASDPHYDSTGREFIEFPDPNATKLYFANKMDRREEMITNMDKHYIEGNTLPVKDQLKEMGGIWDKEKRKWFFTDKAVAEKAQAIVPASIEPEKYYIGFAPKELTATLKEMGAKYDDKGWYHTDKAVAEKAKELLPEKHYIGYAPKELSDSLKEIGAKYDNKGWYHTSKAVADSAHKLVLASQPRFYLAGDTLTVKNQLKEMGCKWDEHHRQMYHTDKAVAEKAQNIVPEKHYIGSAPKELSATLKEMGAKWDSGGWYHTDKAVAEKARQKILEVEPRHYLNGNTYGLNTQLKELGCRFDGTTKQWYAPSEEIARQAQAVIENGAERHYITNVPYKLNGKMQDLGCRWDKDTKQWFHTDPKIAQQAERLIEQSLEHGKSGNGADYAANPVVQPVTHEM